MSEYKYRILQVHNYYQLPGGEDTVVANEKKLLEEKGHKVVQYTRSNSEIKTFSLIKKLMLPFTSLFSFKTYRDIKRIIREEQIDIVHVHNTLTLVSPSVYYASLSCKVQVIQTMHNFRLLCPGATFYRDGKICEDCVSKGLRCAIKHKCYRDSMLQTLLCVVNIYIHRLSGIYGKLNYICMTEFNKEKLLDLKCINSNNIYIKPHFIDCNYKMGLSIAERPEQFVFVGRLEKIKGIDILLEAWKIIGNEGPKLLICGNGPLEEKCVAFINENQLDNIELMGYVEHEQLMEIISNSKALIVPSVCYETFGMTILEAYSTGTPVISSNIGNIGRIVSEAKLGMCFNIHDINSLIQCIDDFCNNKFSAADDFKDYYSKETNYQLFIKIYEDILKRYKNDCL